MSDLRYDPLNDLWVAIAGNRRSRPMEFVPLEQVRKQIICPFCKGNEDETPPALLAIDAAGLRMTDADDPANWLTRVVANKYPSFSTREIAGLAANPNAECKLADASYPFTINRNEGVQELVIPTPRHVGSLGGLSDLELQRSFEAHQLRMQSLEQNQAIQHGMLFLNCRSAAGASLEHIHWQLVGAPVLSPQLERRIEREAEHFDQQGCSLIERLRHWEQHQQTRVLRTTDHFCVICPFASQFPFQVQILPLQSDLSFVGMSPAVRDELAWNCRDVVRRFEALLDHPAYNVLLQSSTLRCPAERQAWYFELFPRLTTPAGFEWGTDIWVNPVAPETAASALRRAHERNPQPTENG